MLLLNLFLLFLEADEDQLDQKENETSKSRVMLKIRVNNKHLLCDVNSFTSCILTLRNATFFPCVVAL